MILNIIFCSIPVTPEFIVQYFYRDMFYFCLQQPGSSVASAQPYVYLKCGHVHGLHTWNSPERNAADKRTCPVCLQVGRLSAFSITKIPQRRIFGGCVVTSWCSCMVPRVLKIKRPEFMHLSGSLCCALAPY